MHPLRNMRRMNLCVLDQNAALQGNTGPGTTWANAMNFRMNHAPDARLIDRPIDLQSTVLLLLPMKRMLMSTAFSPVSQGNDEIIKLFCVPYVLVCL